MLGMTNDLRAKALADLFQHLIPEMILGALACVLFLGGTWKANRALWAGVTLAGIVLAGVALWFGPAQATVTNVGSAGNYADRFTITSGGKGYETPPLVQLTGAGGTGAVAHAVVTKGIVTSIVLDSPGNGAYTTFNVVIDPPHAVVGMPLVFDHLTQMIRWIALGCGLLLTLFGWSEVPPSRASDFFACLVIIVAGMSFTAAANDLVFLFLALELVSIPTYVLLYLPRSDKEAHEAAIKYFLLSVFSSALLLFGFSYLYGLGGTTNLAAMQSALGTAGPSAMPPIGLVALIMVVAGLGFRITAVPFHFYAPDVYQGTATICAALLSLVPKVVGFTALVRVLGFVLPLGVAPRADGIIGESLGESVPVLFWFLAVVSMSLGNLLALLQDNVRRLLAYSSVAHTGYMLMALATAPLLASGQIDGAAAVSALFFYVVAYGVMTTGAFAVLSYLESDAKRIESMDDLAGLGSHRPGLALVMTIFLFSLIGIPLTAGFAGKFLIFFGAMAVPEPHAALYRTLALVGVINAAIGGWYYLRIVAIMYLRPSLEAQQGRRTWPGLATLLICGALTLGFGVPPGVDWLMGKAQQAVKR